MKFDRVIRSILKEDEERVVEVKGGTGGSRGYFGREFEAPELDDELEIQGTMPGSLAVVALEVIQRSIDLVKKYDIPVPDKMEHLLFDIYTNDLSKPDTLFLTYGWTVDENEDKDVGFFYTITAPGTSPDELFKSTPHRITLDQLKQMAQKEITDFSMKGHDFEDLYTL
jgi:hypothetical protein